MLITVVLIYQGYQRIFTTKSTSIYFHEIRSVQDSTYRKKIRPDLIGVVGCPYRLCSSLTQFTLCPIGTLGCQSNIKRACRKTFIAKSRSSIQNFLLNVRKVEIAFRVIKCRNDDVACLNRQKQRQVAFQESQDADVLITSTTMHSSGRQITNKV